MGDKKNKKVKIKPLSLKALSEGLHENRKFIREVAETAQMHLQRLLEGLLTTQQNVNKTWGLINGVLRLQEKIGIEQGWWKDRFEYQDRLQSAVQELAEESRAHMTRELERIKTEGGVVAPEDTVANVVGAVVQKEMSHAKED